MDVPIILMVNNECPKWKRYRRMISVSIACILTSLNKDWKFVNQISGNHKSEIFIHKWCSITFPFRCWFFVKWRFMAFPKCRLWRLKENRLKHTANGYPSMGLTSDQQKDLVISLKQKLESSCLQTAIILYDHNWEDLEYARNILRLDFKHMWMTNPVQFSAAPSNGY